MKEHFAVVIAIKNIIRPFYKSIRNLYRGYKAISSDKRIGHVIKGKAINEKIKVGFIAQYPPCWDKQENVYEMMSKDKRFEVTLIIPPDYDFINSCLYSNKSSIMFYINKYPSADYIDLINLDSSSEEKLNSFDYIFYDRPYNNYLPNRLKSDKMSRYSRVCSIPYCTDDWAEGLDNYSFEKDMYMLFASSKELKKYYQSNKMFRKRKILFLGYPAYEKCFKLDHIPSERFTILWTPRWSYDSYIGGSHFLEYKNNILNLVDELQIRLIIRPHPLMWDNLIKEGLMSKEEELSFIKTAEGKGIIFDNNKMIEDTFPNVDLMITDISSVMSMFFVTGRPIIYCPSEGKQLSVFLENIVSSLYVANNWNAVKKCIVQLLEGNDEKKSKRNRIIEEEFSDLTNITSNIVDYVAEDYYRYGGE